MQKRSLSSTEPGNCSRFVFCRVIVVTLLVTAATGCSDLSKSDPSGTAAASDPSAGAQGSGDSALPSAMSSHDRLLERRWFDANELCQGSSDGATIDKACPHRDRLEHALERRGWCWAFEDWTIARVDFRWHRCTQKSLARSERSSPVSPDSTVPGAPSPDTDGGASHAPGLAVDQRPAPPRPQTRNQRMDDARAAVREDWQTSGISLHQISLAWHCGIVDRITAGVAVNRVELSMQDDLTRAGLLGDPSMSITAAAKPFLESGAIAAANGGCGALTPASRGHLRQMVAALAN